MQSVSQQTEIQTKQHHNIPAQSIQKATEAKEMLFKKLSGKLMEVITHEGPAAAIEVCSKEASNMAQSVGKTMGLNIGRTALKKRNPKNQPPEWAPALLEAATEKPLFHALPNHRTGALFPIKLKAQCLVCHGDSVFIPNDVQQTLNQLYPEDQATGFKVDDLRGWFWVEVNDPQEELPPAQKNSIKLDSMPEKG